MCESRLRSERRIAGASAGPPGQGPQHSQSPLLLLGGPRALHGGQRNAGAAEPRRPLGLHKPAQEPFPSPDFECAPGMSQVYLSAPMATPLRHCPVLLLLHGSQPSPLAGWFVVGTPAPRPSPSPLPALRVVMPYFVMPCFVERKIPPRVLEWEVSASELPADRFMGMSTLTRRKAKAFTVLICTDVFIEVGRPISYTKMCIRLFRIRKSYQTQPRAPLTRPFPLPLSSLFYTHAFQPCRHKT